jgi:hypothetical protein
VVGGGGKIVQGTTGSPNKIALASSFPSTTILAGTWTATAITTEKGNNHPGTIQAYAICAKS